MTDDRLDQLADRIADRVVDRVADLLAADLAPSRLRAEPMIDATEAGRRLGVSRSTIYQRAEELGAVRVGSGNRPACASTRR